MRSLDKPAVSGEDAFALCVDSYRDETKKSKLHSISRIISESGTKYDSLAENHALHTMPNPSNLGDVSTEEMVDLYKRKLVEGARPRREIYDQILAAANNCPLCGIGVRLTIDHYLPKSHYPSVAVLPLNLVPACTDCNKEKHDRSPTCFSEQTFHPYYDSSWSEIEWLYASIHEVDFFETSFFPIAPVRWPKEAAQRLENHMEILKLNCLYQKNAVSEFSEIQYRLRTLHQSGGHSVVSGFLSERFEDIRSGMNGPNSWKVAFYRAMAESKWFRTTGFNAKL